MAIADLATYKAALGRQREFFPITISGATLSTGRAFDQWRLAQPIGAQPTTAVVPDNDTLGALGQRDPNPGSQLSIIGARYSSVNPGNIIVADRLSHQSGLDASISTAQTTNLPTAALTRYTGGEGVMIGLTIYGILGTVAQSVSVEYTNQAGVGLKNTPAVQIGATAFREVARMIILPLESGDTGVRSVESVTLSGSTGSIGNFGVTLFKPLYAICVSDTSGVLSAAGFITGNTAGGIAKIEDGACLFPISIMASTSATGAGAILLEEN